ncbi:MAG TPA: Calx-beta domain-containing protein, partial [Bacillota bacterium]|nr:Calx-beta domain-containing protein [Bacillota bacterium]
ADFVGHLDAHGGLAGNGETFEVWLSQAGGGASLGALTNVTVTLMDGPAGTAGAPDTNYVVQLDGPVQRILPLADGRAIIAGSFTNVNGQLCPNLVRLLADGTRDPGFGRTQALDGEVYAMALDSAGRLLVAGYFQRVDGVWRPGLARFGTDGTLDMAFKPFEGWPTNSYGGITMQSLAVLADGSIVCGGEIPEDNYYTRDALLKFSPAGDLDTAFTNRMPPSLIATKLSPLPDGDFLLIGGGFGGSLVRLHPDGSINFGFLPPADRQFAYYGGDLGVLPDGRVTVAGIPSSFYGLLSLPPVWRLNPDGSLDSGFSVSNSVSAPGNLQSVDALSVAADGRVLVAGSFSTATSSMRTLRRLQADGAMDWSFDPGTGLKATASSGSVYLNALVSLPGGGWLLGGDFASYNGFNQPHLVKVLPEAVTQPLVISFNVTNAAVTVRETNTVLTFEVRRGGDAFSPASVTVRTADGTATAGQDYQPIDTTLNFGLGEWSKTIGVTLLDDRLVESTEQFTLYLTNATSGFSLASPSAVAVSIQNDDAAVEFTASQYQGVEEDGFVLVAVKWSGALTTNLQATVKIVPQIGSSTDLGVSSLLVQYGVDTYTGTNWLRLPIVDNAQHQTTRQFRLELVGSGNLFAGARSNAVLVLEDRDFTTTPARGVAGVVEAMANAPGGGVYVVGDFTGVHGVARNRVARLLPNGEVDTGFDPGVGPNA